MSDQQTQCITKEILKQQSEDKNMQCHYYEKIINTTTDMIALTDGYRFIDANTAMVNFCESVGRDVYSQTFSFDDFFERINKFDYIFEGYQDKHWYELALEKSTRDCRVGIKKGDVVYTFNLSLVPLEPYEAVYVMTLTDVTGLIGYKTTLEEGIKSSMKDREKSQLLLRQYDKAIEASTLVYKCNTDGIITYANKALSEAFLYGYGELIGKHISVFRGPTVSDTEYLKIWGKLKSGKMHRSVMENTDKMGGIHYFDVAMIPILDQEDNVIEYLSLRHEITDVMVAKEAAVKMLNEKNKFFDQVSHELRTPLNAIINFTDQALENFEEIFDDEETRDLVHMYIERSHNNSQHLLHLINSLLDMAKLRSGKEKYDMDTINVVSFVREVYEATSGVNTKPTVEYILDLPDQDIYVMADSLRLRQILTNLISNALKFTEWGYVRVHVKELGEECWIEIEDTGIGIPTDKLERIFEPFEQVGTHDQGTGLGLGIVSEYAKGMKMQLNVHSSLGEGSSFILKASIVDIL